MKKALLVFLVSFVCSAFVTAQEAKKIDELTDYQCEDLMARLDAFAIEIQKKPSLTGIVIVYEGKYANYTYDRQGNSKIRYVLPTFGESTYRSQIMQAYLFNNRGLSKNQALFIDGGDREKHSIELWIMPQRAKLPKPSPTSDKTQYRKGKTPVFDCRIG